MASSGPGTLYAILDNGYPDCGSKSVETLLEPSAVSATPLEPGAVIGGKYRLDRLLGQGGMGSVFAAENTLTGKQVAIKCMNDEIAASPEASQRFVREAKASARIRHPNVVDVYDVISENGASFLVMEYLEGEPLSALMLRETTQLSELIRLLVCAMRGVAAAHRMGVIHRDIKPENIFLAREGDDQQIVPKVLDFGISKLQGPQDIQLTAPGATLGTVLYMSTEQLRGAVDIDARADVYAFGVILYQAITGRAPFESETYSALIIQIMTEQAVPVKDVRPDVPTKLSQLVHAAMAKQREERVPSLDAFIAQLEPFADDERFRFAMTQPVPRAPSIRTPHSAPPLVAAKTEPAHATTTPAEPVAARADSDSLPSVPRTSLRGVWLVLAVACLALGGWLVFGSHAPQAEAPLRAAEATEHVVKPAPPSAQTAVASPEPAAVAPEHIVRPAPLPEPVKPVAAAPDPAPAPKPQAPAPAPVSVPRVEPVPPAAVSKRPPVSNPTSTPTPMPPTAAPVPVPPKPVASPAAAKAGCNPNFYFDDQGEKHFKPECF
jgi:serine/threonine protein kinase